MVEVLEEEATEDIYRLGAVEVPEQNYFKTRILAASGHRLLWLLVLLVANTITGWIILDYSDLLESVIALAAFIPLLIGSGGNIGSQTSTVFVRGLALKEITAKNASRLIIREVGVGLLRRFYAGVASLCRSHLRAESPGSAGALACSHRRQQRAAEQRPPGHPSGRRSFRTSSHNLCFMLPQR